MFDQVFVFSLRLPGTGRFDAMVTDLASDVLRHLGFTPAAIVELGGELQAGLPPGTVGGAELNVRFQARGGEIEIVVSQDGRRVIRVSRRLP